jgi:hypothetical protein
MPKVSNVKETRKVTMLFALIDSFLGVVTGFPGKKKQFKFAS